MAVLRKLIKKWGGKRSCDTALVMRGEETRKWLCKCRWFCLERNWKPGMKTKVVALVEIYEWFGESGGGLLVVVEIITSAIEDEICA